MHIELTSATMTPGQIDMVAQDMSLDLSDTGEVDAKPESRDLAPGERGVATVIGGVVIELLKTSGVTKMIEVLGAYLAQEPSMEAKVKLGNGAEIVLNSKNVRSKEFEDTLLGLVAGAQGS